MEAQRVYSENPPIRRTARIMNVCQGTVKKVLGLDKTLHRPIDYPTSRRTIVRMDVHYHIWHYRRDQDGTIRCMERDETPYPTRRKANYALSDGRQYWKAGQVLQCLDGAFCQPLAEEIVDRSVPFGPKYVGIEQLAEQARSIRPAAKRVKAMKLRQELDAASRIKSLEIVKAELAEHQADVDAELARLRQQN